MKFLTFFNGVLGLFLLTLNSQAMEDKPSFSANPDVAGEVFDFSSEEKIQDFLQSCSALFEPVDSMEITSESLSVPQEYEQRLPAVQYGCFFGGCNKILLDKKSFYVHLDQHRGRERNLQCALPECSFKNWVKLSEYERHKASHLKCWICPVPCGRSFLFFSRFDKHVRTKHGVSPAFVLPDSVIWYSVTESEPPQDVESVDFMAMPSFE